MSKWHDPTYKVDRSEIQLIETQGPAYQLMLWIEAPDGSRENKSIDLDQKPPDGFEESLATRLEDELNSGRMTMDTVPHRLTRDQMIEIHP